MLGGMYGGGPCMAGGMCSGGACMAGGMCGGEGHAWQGAYVVRGGHAWQIRVTVNAGATHPTGMHSCKYMYVPFLERFVGRPAGLVLIDGRLRLRLAASRK